MSTELNIPIEVIEITNTGRQPIQVGVAPPDEFFLFEVTDLSDFDGSFLFDGSGTVKIQPGRRFTIEEYRINLGQIQNYIDIAQARVFRSTRILGSITDISE
jgi:hypothetical protein